MVNYIDLTITFTHKNVKVTNTHLLYLKLILSNQIAAVHGHRIYDHSAIRHSIWPCETVAKLFMDAGNF